jgi:zinc protease
MRKRSADARSAQLLLTLLAATLFGCATSPAETQRRGSAAPQPAPARAELVTTVEGISEYRLPNGLRVVLFPDASRPSTTVNITYFVGSRHEGYGETGMAHLLEHLLFKGTPTHPDIPAELTAHGGRANGTTWFDRTNYFITMPASAENLEWALRLEADRMVSSFVRKEDLDSEMTVVRNEFESRDNNPLLVSLERTFALAYRWHAYGRSVVGARSDLENVPIERLQAFYRKYYQPDNALLVISGQFDEQQALRWVEQYYSNIPRPQRTGEMHIWDTYTREPVQDGERFATIRRVGDVQYVIMGYHVAPGAHEDNTTVDLVAHVLGNAPAGRLYQALVETGKASQVSTIPFFYQTREPGLLIAYAQVRTDQSTEEVRTIMARTLDEMASTPATEQELERARAARLRDWQLSFNNSERVGIDITEWSAVGDWRLMFIHRDRLRAATAGDLARVSSHYLKPSNRTVTVFIPEAAPLRAEVPDVPDIQAMVAHYTGTETTTAGVAFEPTHENIEAHTQRITLDNGFQIALLPKETRGNTVLVQFTQRFGNERALMGRSMHANLTSAMLMRGTQHRSRQDITDELSRLQTRMNVSGSAGIVSASLETNRENLPAVMRLLHEVLREPAFAASEFATVKREWLARFEAQKSEPSALGSVAYQRHLNPRPPGHPQYSETFEEAIAAINATTLDHVRAFHRDMFGTGRGGSVTVLGDFNSAEVEALTRELFRDWPVRTEYTRVGFPHVEVEPTTMVINTPDKSNAFFMAGLSFPMRDDHPDYPAMLLAGQIMGGGFLNSRLATRIRQQEGISYGIGASISARPLDERGEFTTFAIYAPENADRLVAAYREEVERALRDGFTADEVEAAKRGWSQQRDVARATDAQLVGMLQNGLFLDRTLEYDAQLEERVRALSPEELGAAMRRHIDPSRVIIVKAGDFKEEPVP